MTDPKQTDSTISDADLGEVAGGRTLEDMLGQKIDESSVTSMGVIATAVGKGELEPNGFYRPPPKEMRPGLI